MNFYRNIFFLQLSIFSIFGAPTLRAEPIALPAFKADVVVNDAVSYLRDDLWSSPQEIQHQLDQFLPNLGHNNFGYSPSPYWFHFQIKNTSDEALRRFLALDDYTLGHVELFVTVDGRQISHQIAGGTVHPQYRPRASRRIVFPIDLPAVTTSDIFVRVKTINILHSSMRIYDELTLDQREQNNQWLLGLYYGSVFAILFYNLFLFFTTRDFVFLNYTLFVLVVGITLFIFDGMADLHFPVGGWETVLSSFGCLAIAAGMNFTRQFLRSYTSVWIDRGLSFGIIGSLAVALFGQFSQMTIVNHLTDFVLVYGCVIVVIAGVYAVRKGSLSARYYLVSWMILVPFCLVWVGMMYDFLPYSYFTVHGVHLGSGFEMIFMSLALGNRIKLISRERDDAERKAQDSAAVARGAQMIAHDVRRPFALLNTMLLSIDRAATNKELRDTISHYTPAIRGTIQESNDMLTDLMQMHKVNNKPKSKVSLIGILKKSIERAFANCPEKSSIVSFESVDDYWLEVDEYALIRVFTNLIENAAQATADFVNQDRAIKLRWAEAAGSLGIEVVDNGPGVPASVASKLFKHYVTSKPRGHGLGLPVVKELIEANSGQVSYKRTANETIFCVHLPTGERVSIREPLPANLFDSFKPQIILIDDCVFMREAWDREVSDAHILTLAGPETLGQVLAKDPSELHNAIVVTDFYFGSDDLSGIQKVIFESRRHGMQVLISSNAAPSIGEFSTVPRIEKRPHTWAELNQILKQKTPGT